MDMAERYVKAFARIILSWLVQFCFSVKIEDLNWSANVNDEDCHQSLSLTILKSKIYFNDGIDG